MIWYYFIACLFIYFYIILIVYDILGNEVISYNEDQEAGYHRIKFDGTGLPSGIYFYRIQTGTFVDIKKMILLK